MQAQDMLSVVPADLVRTILEQRRAVAQRLPEELERRQEENDRAFKLAKSSRKHLHDLQAAGEEGKPLVDAQHTYDEHEQFRRRASSRLQTVKNNINDSNEAIEFWERISQGEWGHLLEDAERVRSGGKSSYSQAKTRNTTRGDSA